MKNPLLKKANGFDTPAGTGKRRYKGYYPEAIGGGWNPSDGDDLASEYSSQLGGYAAGTRGAGKTQGFIDGLYRSTQEPPAKKGPKAPNGVPSVRSASVKIGQRRSKIAEAAKTVICDYCNKPYFQDRKSENYGNTLCSDCSEFSDELREMGEVDYEKGGVPVSIEPPSEPDWEDEAKTCRVCSRGFVRDDEGDTCSECIDAGAQDTKPQKIKTPQFSEADKISLHGVGIRGSLKSVWDKAINAGMLQFSSSRYSFTKRASSSLRSGLKDTLVRVNCALNRRHIPKSAAAHEAAVKEIAKLVITSSRKLDKMESLAKKAASATHILYDAGPESYTVRVMRGNDTIDEYNGGNSLYDSTSQFNRTDNDAIEYKRLLEWAEQTAKEYAEEYSVPENMVEHNEDLMAEEREEAGMDFTSKDNYELRGMGIKPDANVSEVAQKKKDVKKFDSKFLKDLHIGKKASWDDGQSNENCPLSDRERCNTDDADTCCGGGFGYNEKHKWVGMPCTCKDCHPPLMGTDHPHAKFLEKRFNRVSAKKPKLSSAETVNGVPIIQWEQFYAVEHKGERASEVGTHDQCVAWLNGHSGLAEYDDKGWKRKGYSIIPVDNEVPPVSFSDEDMEFLRFTEQKPDKRLRKVPQFSEADKLSLHGLGVKGSKKPKCPHCGSTKYALMPTDFETAKCDECGKNWELGIVDGINNPSEKTAVFSPEDTDKFHQENGGSNLFLNKETQGGEEYKTDAKLFDKKAAVSTPSDMKIHYSEGVNPGDTLPEVDEIHYLYYAPEPEDEGDNDYYSVVGFKDGVGLFNTSIPAGRLKDVVGDNLAQEIVLGKGRVVQQENTIGVTRPYKSLVVHSREFNEMDNAWLKNLHIAKKATPKVYPVVREEDGEWYIKGLPCIGIDEEVTPDTFIIPGMHYSTGVGLAEGLYVSLYDEFQTNDNLKEGDIFDTPIGQFVCIGTHVMPYDEKARASVATVNDAYRCANCGCDKGEHRLSYENGGDDYYECSVHPDMCKQYMPKGKIATGLPPATTPPAIIERAPASMVHPAMEFPLKVQVTKPGGKVNPAVPSQSLDNFPLSGKPVKPALQEGLPETKTNLYVDVNDKGLYK